MKPYKIIVSEKTTFQRYAVLSDYDTLEEAKKDFDRIIDKFTKENRNKKAWKYMCPFHFAIIKMEE